ncbi:MAG: hypothetical protein N4A33_01305 [Bacteriovoracaceae bacterium]|jgi:hypothetical protein|nr:hypothetical protein [Bacteriovoracaceae bacterium]
MKFAFLKSQKQAVIYELDYKNQSQSSIVVDIEEIEKMDLNLFVITDNDEDTANHLKMIEKEAKFYPVITAGALGLDSDMINDLSFNDLKDIYSKVASSWMLNNNIGLIENMYSITTHLRNLWVQDRNAFFEELWFKLKQNLATTDLSVIFNDLKEEKKKEDEVKRSLFHAVVKGKKTGQIFEAKDYESKLMEEYKNDFTNTLSITEYSPEKGELVMTVKINLSPILIMAKVSGFNQIQQSVLKGLFEGLCKE